MKSRNGLKKRRKFHYLLGLTKEQIEHHYSNGWRKMATTTKTESETTQDNLTGNEYYRESWKRFRKSYDVKNKYYPPGKDYYFGDFKYEATQWNEKMLTKMHKSIRLEGRPNTKATKGQSDSGSS